MKAIKLIAVLVLLAGMAGCYQVGKMPIQYDEAVRNLAPPSDKALVYVVRPSNSGGIERFTVFCDGDSIGATHGRRYIYTLQSPGPHIFVSKAENTSELPIVLEAGRTYYLEQKIKFGIATARANLERIVDVEAGLKLAMCSLSDEIVAAVPGAEEYMRNLAREKAKHALSGGQGGARAPR